MGGCILLEQRLFSSALASARSAVEQFSRQAAREFWTVVSVQRQVVLVL